MNSVHVECRWPRVTVWANLCSDRKTQTGNHWAKLVVEIDKYRKMWTNMCISKLEIS